MLWISTCLYCCRFAGSNRKLLLGLGWVGFLGKVGLGFHQALAPGTVCVLFFNNNASFVLLSLYSMTKLNVAFYHYVVLGLSI